VVSGIPYEQFMQQRLFDPLGMKDTTFWPTAAQLARLAKTYKLDAQKKDLVEGSLEQLTYPLDDRMHRFPMPAGGIFSTADDVARFARMILNGGLLDGKRYLSAQSLREMTTVENAGMAAGITDLASVFPRTAWATAAHTATPWTSIANGADHDLHGAAERAWGTEEGKKIVPTLDRLADELVRSGAAAASAEEPGKR